MDPFVAALASLVRRADLPSPLGACLMHSRFFSLMRKCPDYGTALIPLSRAPIESLAINDFRRCRRRLDRSPRRPPGFRGGASSPGATMVWGSGAPGDLLPSTALDIGAPGYAVRERRRVATVPASSSYRCSRGRCGSANGPVRLTTCLIQACPRQLRHPGLHRSKHARMSGPSCTPPNAEAKLRTVALSQ